MASSYHSKKNYRYLIRDMIDLPVAKKNILKFNVIDQKENVKYFSFEENVRGYIWTPIILPIFTTLFQSNPFCLFIYELNMARWKIPQTLQFRTEWILASFLWIMQQKIHSP